MSDDIKAGDRVRVTIEADVRSVFGRENCGLDLTNGGAYIASLVTNRPGVTVEKIEPPVEVFQPGDVVRHKAAGFVYTITDDPDKVVSHHDGHVVDGGAGFGAAYLTSRYYEKVTLS